MQWQAQGGIESLNLMIKVAIDGCCASVVPGNLRFCEACDAFRIRPRDLCNFSLCSRGKNFDRNRARPTASHITGTLVSDIRMIFVQLFFSGHYARVQWVSGPRPKVGNPVLSVDIKDSGLVRDARLHAIAMHGTQGQVNSTHNLRLRALSLCEPLHFRDFGGGHLDGHGERCKRTRT